MTQNCCYLRASWMRSSASATISQSGRHWKLRRWAICPMRRGAQAAVLGLAGGAGKSGKAGRRTSVSMVAQRDDPNKHQRGAIEAGSRSVHQAHPRRRGSSEGRSQGGVPPRAGHPSGQTAPDCRGSSGRRQVTRSVSPQGFEDPRSFLRVAMYPRRNRAARGKSGRTGNPVLQPAPVTQRHLSFRIQRWRRGSGARTSRS